MACAPLSQILNPDSIAILGASRREGSLGKAILKNVIGGGFEGNIWPVNPKYEELEGFLVFENVGALPGAPDLAVIATPPQTIVPLLHELGKTGTKGVVIITAGVDDKKHDIIAIASDYDMRLIGPNCVGVFIPHLGLNASFAHLSPQAGNIALISQSGAIITSLIDWARPRDIGFSYLMSLGNAFDVDIADMLDHLSQDRKTKAILIYMEAIKDAGAFMSAAQRAALIKPVIVLKVGRDQKAAQAVMSHTGKLAGSDEVYQAAFDRAGVVRVDTLEELFDVAELLTHQRSLKSNRILVITNGGGLGIIAADAIAASDLILSELDDELHHTLDVSLPATWSQSNPIDIVGDSGPKRYRVALQAALRAEGADAILVLNCPTSIASNIEIAKAVVDEIEDWRRVHPVHKPVLTAWIGEETANAARQVFKKADIPAFETAEDAVHALQHLYRYKILQEASLRKPAGIPTTTDVDIAKADSILRNAHDNGRLVLNEDEAKAVLVIYGIPVVLTYFAATADEVAIKARLILADEIYTACVIKIVSKDLTHKSDIGGVALNLVTPEVARAAAEEMWFRIEASQPLAKLEGFSVQPMMSFLHSRELIAGIMRDDAFGSVLMVGAGGTSVEVVNDKAIGLPPLENTDAEDMISKTRVAKLLDGYRNVPAADREGVVRCLVALSRLTANHPVIRELDMNPLIAHPGGVVALDARIGLEIIASKAEDVYSHLAIAPYPKQLEERAESRMRTPYLLRPVMPQDEDLYSDFLKAMEPDDLYKRFFSHRKDFDHTFIAHLTHVDYRRDMAFAAIDEQTGDIAGVARLVRSKLVNQPEFAIIVRSALKGHGIGWLLMQKLIEYAKQRGMEGITGEVLGENKAMLKMCAEFGFQMEQTSEFDEIYRVTLDLSDVTLKRRAV